MEKSKVKENYIYATLTIPENKTLINMINNHEIHRATPPVAGIILSCEDLSLGTANNLNFIDAFLTISNKNQVIITGIATKNNIGFSVYIREN